MRHLIQLAQTKSMTLRQCAEQVTLSAQSEHRQ